MGFEIACTNEEKVKVTLAPTTEGGAPVAPLNLAVTVVSGDGSAQVLDANSFELISGSLIGDTQFAVAADFDPAGDGSLEHFTDTITLHAGEAKVVTFGFTAGTPEVK